MNTGIIKWRCKECGDICFSDPLDHHTMNTCRCGKSGLDLETYSCRIMGDYEKIEEIPRNFEDTRKVPVWGTYGKSGDDEYKKISVSEMSNGHMKTILNTQKSSEFIQYLILNEQKRRLLK